MQSNNSDHHHIISNNNGQDDDDESDKHFSVPVREYQRQVEDIIAWLFSKEEQLQERQSGSDLQGAKFSQLIDEYSRHEKFIDEFCEYSCIISKCKEDGENLKDNNELLTEEDRDEIGIELDAMTVCHQKLEILIYDRLNTLREIIGNKEQTQIGQFEEGLISIERQLGQFKTIGPDHGAFLRQLEEIDSIRAKLEEKQAILNFISKVTEFDEVRLNSLQIRGRSDARIVPKLENINHRWMKVCELVEDLRNKLIQAEQVCKFFEFDSPFRVSLRTLKDSVKEMQSNLPLTQGDVMILEKFEARSQKIIKKIAGLQTDLSRVNKRINEIKNDELGTRLVIDLLEEKDSLQADLDALSRENFLIFDKINREQVNSMIPVPDPITSTSNNDLRFSSSAVANSFSKPAISPTISGRIAARDDTLESFNESFIANNRDLINETYAIENEFDNSISSESKSLLYGNGNELQRGLLYANNNDSQDELSTTSMTASYTNNSLYGMSAEHSSRLVKVGLCHEKVDPEDSEAANNSNCCRVEDWKYSLESFSKWLKEVEISLDIPSTLETIVGMGDDRRNQSCYARLSPYRQLLLLNEIENRITSTCQDEFDCLILQGHAIIKDLVPAIGENEYESNSNKLKGILSDIEMRYATVKKCLNERKQELADEREWKQLIGALESSCDYIVTKLDEIIPETNIGIDLITLAQQQDQLIHMKTDLEENTEIKSSIEKADEFLKICDFLQQQQAQSHDNQPSQSTNNFQQQQLMNVSEIIVNTNRNIWTSFRKFKNDIEKQRDSLLIHCSELSHSIEERLKRLDDVHKEMHALQHKMQELASKLQFAEILRLNWISVDYLSIEELSKQLEDLKLFRERVSEIESIHQSMNNIYDWMVDSDVPLSEQNLNRVTELNDIWNMIQISIEERQKSIEQAFDNQSSSEQRFLNQTLSDLPRWERRVADSKVPYFIDHETNKTHWDHPKFDELLKNMTNVKQYIFSAYRTALKLRLIQRKLGIDMLMLEHLIEIFEVQPASPATLDNQIANQNHVQIVNGDTLVGVEQIIYYLKAIYEKIKSDEKSTLDVPLSIELTLNWLLNLYDSTRTGHISVLSLKVGLALICCATREEKYSYMYKLIANQRTGSVDGRKLGTLFETCMRIPIYLGEGDSFGGSEIIETSIKDCFSRSKYNPQDPNCIDLQDYLNWLKSEPQFIIWLPVLHRLLISENVCHKLKCKLCGANPIIGLRFRCLKCFKFNICQNCFLSGRHIYEHHDPMRHTMQEYCNTTSSGENVRDFTKILKNKLNPRAH